MIDLLANRPGFRVVQGNILQDKADLLVCPVNMIGTMGAGLAKQFAKEFSGLEDQYQFYCRNRQFDGFESVCNAIHSTAETRRVILFPTKQHWRNNSRIGWV